MHRFLSFWLCAAALALCSWAAQAAEPLRLLMPEPHGPLYRAIYAGIEKGWFKEEGVEMVFMPIPGGAVNMLPQLTQGVGDIAWAGGYTVLQARAKGVPVVGIASGASESQWSLISHKDANIRTPADLKGKTIGVVAFSSATYFMAQALLRSGKLGEADVNIRPIGLGGPALLSQKQVDAYIWFKTQGLALQAKGAQVNVMDLDPYIPLPQDLTLATESTVEKRRDDIKSYLKVLKRAEAFVRDPKNDAESDAFLAKYAPEAVQDPTYLKVVEQEERDRSARDRSRNWRWGSTDPKRLEASQDFLFDLRVIERKTPVGAMFTDSLLP